MEEDGYKNLIKGNVISSLKNLEAKLEKNEPAYSDELSALPVGHPLRAAIEEAKERRVERLSREKSVKETSARMREKRVAKKANNIKKRIERDTITQSEVSHGRNAIVELNNKIESLRVAAADLLKAMPKIKDDLQKFPDEMTKLSRLERVVGSIHKGMSGTNFNKIRITGDE